MESILDGAKRWKFDEKRKLLVLASEQSIDLMRLDR